ncbi:scd2/ral3 [Mycena maculata]|uniref:Scd2/ral3 n=1 Tax=Mycena maculata TaxID=230809 RepID=A0AAD7NC55_9AGAR|nr:scd2/ral3 [Mycena maculata]
MKSIRKSLNGSKDSSGIRAQISTPVPLPAVSKPPSAILPPQKVIRALSAYRPQAPQELPFKKGDFFYVLRDVDNQGAWYEAHNPVSGARGLVPKDMFEEFNKNSANLRTIGAPGPPAQFQPQQAPQTQFDPISPKASAKSQVFYAIVLHDFFAERADELDAKRGDAITVVAQSNREWFVAKPIGRLGRPGLIPVSFVEIHDPATGKAIPDVNALMDRGDLPKVEDWKRAMFNYKQNSIALGVIDAPSSRDSVPNSPFMREHSPMPPPEPAIAVQGPSPHNQAYSDISDPPPPSESPDALPEGILLSANVVSFHFEMDEYWFRVDGIFQPYASSPGQPLPPAKSLILFRVYNDFYDFQVSLLDTFPREAGRQPPNPRMLPYMPGPAQDVDDALTATRRSELDEYVNSLCELSNAGAKYILEHQVVREFLALKPGDVENEIPPRVKEMDALFGQGQSQYDDQLDQYGNEVQDSLGRLRMDDHHSDGSDYEDEGYAPSPQRQQHPYGQAEERRPSAENGLRLQAHTQNHQRSGSSSSLSRTRSPYSRADSPLARSRSPPTSGWNDNPTPYNNGPPPITSSPSSSSLHSHSNSVSTRSRSGSVANINSPSISAANPQTAFVKIKIFDRIADDLIAIRVHPRVTHNELMDKVQARLGGEVLNLKYRDSMSNQFVGLDSDEQLRAWIEGTDKHVLYAD